MEIVYWSERVQRFILQLDKETRMRVEKTVDLLEEKGNFLDMPDSKSLGGGLFELRTHGKRKIRLLYIFKNSKAYVIHGFVKKVWKIPRNDLDYARKIQKEIIRLA